MDNQEQKSAGCDTVAEAVLEENFATEAEEDAPVEGGDTPSEDAPKTDGEGDQATTDAKVDAEVDAQLNGQNNVPETPSADTGANDAPKVDGQGQDTPQA